MSYQIDNLQDQINSLKKRVCCISNSSNEGITSVKQDTAPTDVNVLWIDNNTNNNGFEITKLYSNGSWNPVSYKDVLSGYVSDLPPLYVLATGQSNMQESNQVGIPTGDLSVDNRVQRWNGTAWEVANIAPANGLAFQFAKRVAKAENRVVRYINIAVGGMPIEQWYNGATMDAAITSTITAAGVSSIDVILFRQGEANSADTEAQYSAKIQQVVSLWQSRSWFNNVKPIIVGGLKTVSTGSALQKEYGVQQFYENIPFNNRIPNLLYAHNDGISLLENSIHIYGEGMDISASRLFAAYINKGHVIGSGIIRLNGNSISNGSNGNLWLNPNFVDVGSYNIALSHGTLQSSNVNKIQDIAIGLNALQKAENGFQIGIGVNAARENITGQNGVYIGLNAGLNSTSSNNTVINGGRSGTLSGGGNTLVGFNTYNTGTGTNVTALGQGAMSAMIGATNAIAIGINAASSAANNSNNFLAIGGQSFQSATNVTNNIAIGHQAGNDNNFANVAIFGYTGKANTANQIALHNNTTAYTNLRLQGISIGGINSGQFVLNSSAATSGSLVFDIAGTDKFSRPFTTMTTAQRDTIATPAIGAAVYCTDCIATDGSTGVNQTYNGTTWKNWW